MAKANLEFNLGVISHEGTFLQSMTTESASLNLTRLGRIPEFTPIHEVTAQPQEYAAPVAISQSFTVNYPEAIQEIANLLADNIRVFLHLKDLDREILAKKQEYPQLSADEALEEVLLDWEGSALGGFDEKPFIVALAISEADFNEVLQIPRLFHDMGITYWHGIETHRLQWQIIMREMRANPEKFKDNNGTRLTASLLNTAITNARIKDSKYSLFHELFDRDNMLPTGSCPDTLLNSLRACFKTLKPPNA